MDGSFREYVWCDSREQRICTEVCQHNLAVGKCRTTKKGCKLRANPMSEGTKVRLQEAHRAKRGRPRKDSPRKKTPSLCEKIKRLGPQNVAAKLYLEKRSKRGVIILRDITEDAVGSWIKRETIPTEYQEAVLSL